MDFVALTRQLVDIESITGNEGPVGDFLSGQLNRLGYEPKKMRVEGERSNVYATTPQQPQPTIVFSTHMDTVPPFIRSSEDGRAGAWRIRPIPSLASRPLTNCSKR